MKKGALLLSKTLAFIVAASFWLFVATLPPFQMGIWIDSESVIVFAHSLFALCGLILLFCTFQDKKYISLSPISAIFLCFYVLSMIATLWAHTKVLHVLGTPTLGEGATLWGGLFLLSVAMEKSLHQKHDTLLGYSCLVSSLVALTLCLFNHQIFGIQFAPEWTPYSFNAFLASMSVGLIGALLVFPHLVHMVCFTFIMLIIVSLNKTAWVFLSFGLIYYWVFSHTQYLLSALKKLIFATPFLIIGFILHLRFGLYFQSLYSRKLGFFVYIQEWFKNPLSLFTGHGWGAYYEYLQIHLQKLPVSLYQNDHWSPTWDGVERLDFHCMHQGLESLFALGVSGIVLLSFLYLRPLAGKIPSSVYLPAFLGSLLFTALTSTWFTTPALWPFYIFFLVAFSRAAPSFNIPPILYRFTIVFTTLGCILTAFVIGDTALRYEPPKTSIFYSISNKSFLPLSKRTTIYAQSGFHMGQWMIHSHRWQHIKPETKLKILHSLKTHYRPSLSSLMSDVPIAHFLNSFRAQFKTLGVKEKLLIYQLWGVINNKIMTHYPSRLDLLFDYITFLFEQKEFQQADQLLIQLEKIDAHNSAVMWLRGLYFMECNGDLAKALPYLKNALAAGVDRWIAVSSSLAKVLKKDSSNLN